MAANLANSGNGKSNASSTLHAFTLPTSGLQEDMASPLALWDIRSPPCPGYYRIDHAAVRGAAPATYQQLRSSKGCNLR